MQARDLLKIQFNRVHQFMEATIKDVSQDQADHKVPGSTTGTIGQIYVHAIVGEDFFVGRANGGRFVVQQDGWAEKLGLPEMPAPRQDESWAGRQFDIGTARAYAKAVYAATDAYFDTVDEAALDVEQDFGPFGTMPLAAFLGTLGISHPAQHWGEIAALKGVQGLKGLPF